MTYPSWLRPLDGQRLLVTGADGFIGSHVVRAALDAGCAAVLGLAAKEPWRLADRRDDARLVLRSLGAWWQPGAAMAQAEGVEVDAAVLLAYVPPPGADQLEHERVVNGAGSGRWADALSRRGARVVFTSSADVYPPWNDHPVSEDAPTAPASPYGAAKVEAEELVRQCTDAAGVAGAALRLGTVFGPGEDGPRAIPSFLRALLDGKPPHVRGDGSDVRDYVRVQDVAAAICNATALEPAWSVCNVGSGMGRATLEVLRATGAAIGVTPEPALLPTDLAPRRLVLDITAARRWLGLDPDLDLVAAISEQLDWVRSNRAAGILPIRA